MFLRGGGNEPFLLQCLLMSLRAKLHPMVFGTINPSFLGLVLQPLLMHFFFFFFADFSSWTNSQVNVEGKSTFTTPSVLNRGSRKGQGARNTYKKGCCISRENEAFLITLVLNNSKLLGVAFSACASLRLLALLCNLMHPRDPSPSLVIHWRTCDITALRRCLLWLSLWCVLNKIPATKLKE